MSRHSTPFRDPQEPPALDLPPVQPRFSYWDARAVCEQYGSGKEEELTPKEGLSLRLVLRVASAVIACVIGLMLAVDAKKAAMVSGHMPSILMASLVAFALSLVVPRLWRYRRACKAHAHPSSRDDLAWGMSRATADLKKRIEASHGVLLRGWEERWDAKAWSMSKFGLLIQFRGRLEDWTESVKAYQEELARRATRWQGSSVAWGIQDERKRATVHVKFCEDVSKALKSMIEKRIKSVNSSAWYACGALEVIWRDLPNVWPQADDTSARTTVMPTIVEALATANVAVNSLEHQANIVRDLFDPGWGWYLSTDPEVVQRKTRSERMEHAERELQEWIRVFAQLFPDIAWPTVTSLATATAGVRTGVRVVDEPKPQAVQGESAQIAGSRGRTKDRRKHKR
ncbi:MAG: hypothetical protein WCV84_05000 [Patescibacteria group bacterium]